MEEQKLEGFLLIDKPTGITSFDCIRHIKRIIKKKIKIGHAGTLDPFASGLIIIALSRNATKLMSTVHSFHKRYQAQAQLGYVTDSLDATGKTVATCMHTGTNKKHIQQACLSVQPTYTQIPPIYSALKHQGKPLYELIKDSKLSTEALEKIVLFKQRSISIYSLTLTNYTPTTFSIDASVSGGTYIRSLLYDIAQKAGCCATTTHLRRIEIGKYSVDQALKLERITTLDDIKQHLLCVQTILNKS